MIHNFDDDNKYSLDKQDDKMLDALYFRIFPYLKRIEKIDDLKLQKQGIDKKLHFSDGHVIHIDEKKRRKDYGDILLEEYSNYEKKKYGWLSVASHTDYIIYVIMETRRVYVLPFLLLQQAWKTHYKTWLFAYGRVLAKNPDYTTSNIPVPVEELLEAIRLEIYQKLPPPKP